MIGDARGGSFGTATRPVLTLRSSLRARSSAIARSSTLSIAGFGRPGSTVIAASLAWHCIAALHAGQRSSGAVANLITAWCSATSSDCALDVPQLAHAY